MNSSNLYSKKINNDMLPPPSSALSKNISSSSTSRAKISSPLSQNRIHPENYLKPRKNVPTTVTTMMTISNNTHNSSIISKTSPKIPSKLHQNIGVNRYRTNSSPAPMYTSRSSIHRDYYIKQNMNKASTTTSNVTITTNSKINTSTDNKENSNINANTTNTDNNNTNTNVNTNTNSNINSTDNKPETLQINTSIPKKESKDSIKTAPPMTTNNDNSIFNFNNLFGTKKYKFNGLSFLTSIPIVAKLLNLDKENSDNNNSTNNTKEANEDTSKSSTENNKNNSPIDISNGITNKGLAKSPEKSTLSTYTNNSGNNINYISSSKLALQILEEERKGIPEPEQWLQKQVKARAYAIAVANAVAKRNTQNSNNYSQYTTKFTPSNHLYSISSQRKSSTNDSTEIPTYKKETERKNYIEEDDYFIL